MADMCFIINYMQNVSGSLVVSGQALCTPDSGEIQWNTSVGWDDTPAQINAAARDAAITAAGNAGYTVGVTDTKTCLGGAVVLV